jgi:hypothetical protein
MVTRFIYGDLTANEAGNGSAKGKQDPEEDSTGVLGRSSKPFSVEPRVTAPPFDRHRTAPLAVPTQADPASSGVVATLPQPSLDRALGDAVLRGRIRFRKPGQEVNKDGPAVCGKGVSHVGMSGGFLYR